MGNQISVPAVHEVDAGRHDADDIVGPAIDVHGPSDDRLSAKCALPQLVRENRERRPSQARAGGHRVGFSRAEEASVRGLDAEHREQVVVDRQPTARAAADRRR